MVQKRTRNGQIIDFDALISKGENEPAIGNMKVKDVMTKNPISINKNQLAAKALSLMNANKITSLCVHENKNKSKTIGIIHIHNILQSNIS